jgi:ABC-2 type transport system permease protein
LNRESAMMRQIAAIALKEFAILIKDREALALLFAMPVFFILVMSFALGGVFEAGTAARPIEVLLVNQDAGGVAGQIAEDLTCVEGLKIIRNINGSAITRRLAERLIMERSRPLALLFERDFSESVEQYAASDQAEAPRVLLITDPATNRQLLAPVQAAIRALAERRVATARQIRQIRAWIKAWGGPVPEALPGREGISGQKTPAVHMEILAPRGASPTVRPSATEQNVPAYTIFGVFFIVLPLAAGFMREKQEGTFQRILAAPISKSALLLGKLLPYYLVNLVQIALMFTVGSVLFGVHMGRAEALIPVSLALAACANGLGLMVAALGRTEAQIGALGVFCAVVLSALGGMMVPAFVMPELMKTLSRLTPHAWALAGYHDVMLRGLGLASVWKETAVLLGFAAFFYLIALWRFRFTE